MPRQALSGPAHGHLRELSLREVRLPLREVIAGRSVIEARVVEALVSRRTRIAESPVAALTPRELDVLREMAQGKSNSGIGEALFLSASAIEKHVNAIFGKLGLTAEPQVHRRVAAVVAFLRDGEVSLPAGGAVPPVTPG